MISPILEVNSYEQEDNHILLFQLQLSHPEFDLMIQISCQQYHSVIGLLDESAHILVKSTTAM